MKTKLGFTRTVLNVFLATALWGVVFAQPETLINLELTRGGLE
jgi:hypothetical protein